MRPLPLLILSGILFLSTTTLAQMKSLNANDTLAAANLSPKEFREIIADLKKSAFDIPQSFAIGDRQHPQRLGPHAHYGPPAPPNGLARPPWASCKARCCPKEPARKVPRSIYEGAREMARQIARSWEGRI